MTFLATKRFKLLVLVAVVVVVGFGVVQVVTARSNDRTGISRDIPLYVTQQGPLTISVSVAGTIKARDQVILRNEVEGMTTIISIMPEGTEVKKGDLLVEMDSSNMVDMKIQQEILVINTEAEYIGAREALEVTKNQAQSDVDLAELNYQFAQEDLKKYLEGDYPMALKTVEADITLAEGDYKRAQDTLEGSERLFAKSFITQTEYEADQLDALRTKLRLELARDQKKLLEEYELKRNVTQFEANVNQMRMALERAERKAKADVIQAEAKLKATEAQFTEEKKRLEKDIEQIAKTKITAPMDGLVVYATTGRSGGFRGGDNDQPLEEGRSVREREELIYLPTTDAFRADIQIHEANRSKVKPGLPVRLTIDALPGRTFYGVLQSVAPLPNAQTSWMNPDLKVYDSVVNLSDENVDGLRTGMSCLAEIVVDSYEDATYVPIQAVVNIEGEHVVYVASNSGTERRTVEIGLDNNRMIHIKSGLTEGEKVMLEPPLAGSERSIAGTSIADQKFREFSQQVNLTNGNGGTPGAIGPGPGQPGTGPGAPGQGGGPGGPGGGGGFLENLPPEVREKVQNMTREERREYFQQQGISIGGGRGPGGEGGFGGGGPGGGRSPGGEGGFGGGGPGGGRGPGGEGATGGGERRPSGGAQ